jgi:hypothetical protein
VQAPATSAASATQAGSQAQAERPGKSPVAAGRCWRWRGGLAVLVAANWRSLRNLGALSGAKQTAPAAGAAAARSGQRADRPGDGGDRLPAGRCSGRGLERSGGWRDAGDAEAAPAQTPTSFVIKKAGFQPLRYEVIPDRDSMVTLVLRP